MNNEKRCLVDGCGDAIYAKNMCRRHYAQVSRCGILSSVRRSRTCGIAGCQQSAMLSKAYCQRHHAQMRKGREPKLDIAYCSVFDCGNLRERSTYCLTHYTAIQTQECLVGGCPDKPFTRGYCVRHYYQMRTLGKISHVAPKITMKNRVCSDENCTANAVSKGLCRRHYDLARKRRKLN